MTQVPEIIVSDLCPPGKVIICDRDALVLDGGKLIVVENDGTLLAIEDAIERRSDVLKRMAMLMGV